MSRTRIEGLNWFTDPDSERNHEPGIRHSFMASLATALNYMDGQIDPAWLMGAGGFAFRIFVNETMCPSAMSVFHWTDILPETVEQAGHDCYYISRLWEEDELEKERREQAHELIVTAIDNGVPAIVWDVADAEWGLILGYDDDERTYAALTHTGKPSSLSYDLLGKNGIDVLSVTIPGGPNDRSRADIIHNALNAAVNHAEQKEWMDRPKYQNGLAAYDLWALIFERWALITEAGKTDNIGTDIVSFALYYASHHCSARCYARDFLKMIANGNRDLENASTAYTSVAKHLRTVWDHTPATRDPDVSLLKSIAADILQAKAAEAEGIDHIKRYLTLAHKPSLWME